ncbi:shadow of prion protein [Crotalus tigris]|uniref:shadow of prion protein n=1 Tax=Crotalus tigris TaxID=88082 RepID=UPI00192F5FF1|nr:shadow of prion protein [Crotalus tigris]
MERPKGPCSSPKPPQREKDPGSLIIGGCPGSQPFQGLGGALHFSGFPGLPQEGPRAWRAAPASRMPGRAPNPAPIGDGLSGDPPPRRGDAWPDRGGAACWGSVLAPAHPPSGRRGRAGRGRAVTKSRLAGGRTGGCRGGGGFCWRADGRGAKQRQGKPGATERDPAHFLETMRVKCSPAVCWTLLFLLAIFMDSVACKGGRGGARGSARGSARGTSRRSKPAPRYRSSGTALRVAAAAAAGGAAAAAAAAGMSMAGQDSPEYGEMQPRNNTARSTHNPQPWPLLCVSASLWCVALVPRAL